VLEKGSNAADSFSGALLLGTPNGKQSLKEAVIELLSKEWPLSARAIFSKMGSPKGKGCTYQGVHKALFELSSSGVLAKADQSYSLAPNWIAGLEQFCSDVSARYSRELVGVSDRAVFSFNSLYETDKFLVDFVEKLYSPKERTLALHWSHFWVPLFFSQEVYARCRKLTDYFDVYSVTPADTVIDKWCHAYWSKNNWNTKIGVKTGLSGDLLAYRDFVAIVFYSPKARKAIEKTYSSTKGMADFDANEFFETVFESKSKSHVAVMRSKELADSVKAEIVGAFKKAR